MLASAPQVTSGKLNRRPDVGYVFPKQSTLLWKSAFAPEIAVCSTRMASSKRERRSRTIRQVALQNNFWKRSAIFLANVSPIPSSIASPFFPATTPPGLRRTTLPSSSSTFSRTLRVQEECRLVSGVIREIHSPLAVQLSDVRPQGTPGDSPPGRARRGARACLLSNSGRSIVYADIYGKGERGVVLAHGGRFNKESWRSRRRRW